MVKSLLARVQCITCKDELLLGPKDCHAYNMYNMYAKFTVFKQGRLVFQYASVLKIVKATEIILRQRVIEQGISISTDKNLFGRIQSAVLSSVVLISVTAQLPTSMSTHLGQKETTSLPWSKLCQRSTYISEWLLLPKMFSQMVIHKNIPSSRHLINEQILFQNLQIMMILVLYIFFCVALFAR